MAKTVNVGYTDTPISGVTTLTLNRGKLNFKADFKVKSDEPNEAILTNLTCPVDRPEKIRIACQDIKNIYAGTDIDSSVYAPSKRGISILAQVTETFSVSDDVNPAFRVDLSVSAHIVVKVPNSEYITPAHIETLIGRLVSSLYDTGSTATDRISAIMRGALTPSDL